MQDLRSLGEAHTAFRDTVSSLTDDFNDEKEIVDLSEHTRLTREKHRAQETISRKIESYPTANVSEPQAGINVDIKALRVDVSVLLKKVSEQGKTLLTVEKWRNK